MRSLMAPSYCIYYLMWVNTSQFWVLRTLAFSAYGTPLNPLLLLLLLLSLLLFITAVARKVLLRQQHLAGNTLLASLFDYASHTCTLLSAEPAAINLPSGDHATVRTSFLKFA
jgi:hypothetical protein